MARVRTLRVVRAAAALAAQEGERTPRDRGAVMPTNQRGEPTPWPTCGDGMRSWADYAR